MCFKVTEAFQKQKQVQWVGWCELKLLCETKTAAVLLLREHIANTLLLSIHTLIRTLQEQDAVS